MTLPKKLVFAIAEETNTIQFVHYFPDVGDIENNPAQASIPKPPNATGFSFTYHTNPRLPPPPGTYRREVVIPISPNINAIDLVNTFLWKQGPQRRGKQCTILKPEGATGLAFKFETTPRVKAGKAAKPNGISKGGFTANDQIIAVVTNNQMQ